MNIQYLSKLIIIISFFSLFFNCNLKAQEHKEKSLDDAVQYLMMAKYDSSIYLLNELLAETPDYLLAASLKAYIYIELEKNNDALAIINQNLERDPDNILTLALKTNILKLSSKKDEINDEIQNNLNKILSLSPKDYSDYIGWDMHITLIMITKRQINIII